MLHKHPNDLKPLADLKVVSLAINLPGPIAAARLRDLGATVTKIEPPEGDPLARGCAEWFQALHENVSIVPLDLKAASDHERLFALLGDADLLLTSSRPSALGRHGVRAQGESIRRARRARSRRRAGARAIPSRAHRREGR